MKHFLLTLLGLILLQAVPYAWADFDCRSELSYKWKKEETEQVVQWSTLMQAAATEEVAKQKLSDMIIVERSRVMDACRKVHENLAGCIAGKFSAISRTYQTVGFTARKAIEEAVHADCSAQQGTCLESTTTPPKCDERKIEAETPPEEEHAADDKKGKDAKAGAKKK
jgi:hypothetical protein